MSFCICIPPDGLHAGRALTRALFFPFYPVFVRPMIVKHDVEAICKWHITQLKILMQTYTVDVSNNNFRHCRQVFFNLDGRAFIK